MCDHTALQRLLARDLAVELVASALIRLWPLHRAALQFGGLVQRPGRVGQVRAGHGAEVGAAGADDAVGVVGFADGPHRHGQELRLWLRLLTCSQLIEKRVRAGLREQFDTTLPRFDLMAQLERHPEGLKMKELSHRLMVTGGNVTGITDQLVAEGLVERMAVEGDRRAFLVRLTPEGRSAFERMAAQHEQWIVEAFDGLSAKDLDSLHKLLGKVKQHQLDINQRIVTDAE